jgi:hypothetical protein
MASATPPTTVDLSGLPGPVIESIKQLVESLRAVQPGTGQPEVSTRSIIGLFADQGNPTPSLEEFQDARREAWANFPREFPDPAQ